MDPGRFVAQHQSQFFIIGFHDEERSDQDIEEVPEEEHGESGAGGAVGTSGGGVSRSHPMRLSFGSMNGAMRNTLSPVREQADTAEPHHQMQNPQLIVDPPPEIRVGFELLI